MKTAIIVDRFNKKINRTSTCWLWTGAKYPFGYGKMILSRHATMAHRFAWELVYGPIPSGLCVLHKCDVPTCVNPDHLFLGTKADNNKDRRAKGRDGKRYGPLSGTAKLTEHDIREILTSPLGGKALAAKFMVSPAQISRIRNGLRWPHIEHSLLPVG